MKDPNILYDVAIVGYGPVGATLANLLAQQGLSVAVVDAAADVYDKPRAIMIDHEVLRIFQSCGLSDLIERETAPHAGAHFLGVDGEIIKIFDPLPKPYPLGWPPAASFVQPAFERALRAKAAQFENCDVHLSTEAIGIAQSERDTALTARSATDGDIVIRSRYIVACDGANSFVRKSLGITLEDLAFDEWWMVVDAMQRNYAERPSRAFQYCRPSRPGTFVPGPGALRRWEIKLLPGESPDEFGTPENMTRVLAGFTDLTDLEIWRSAVYRFHALLARSWQAGRIFLMGDAVHQTPPFLGQGLCAGIRDASNLAWKLVMVLDGRAGPALLETYEAERKPHVRAIVTAAKEFGKIIGELDMETALARDRKLRAELAEGKAITIRQKLIPDLKAGAIGADATAGTLFPQPYVRSASGAPVRLDDLVPPAFSIVTAVADTLAWLSPESLACWQAIGGTKVVVGSRNTPSAPNGVLHVQETETLFADWLAQRAVKAVVVRPDRYVFGAAVTAEELNRLVSMLVERLNGSPAPIAKVAERI